MSQIYLKLLLSSIFCLFCFVLFILIALIKKKWKEIPIQIIYEDQSSNDFNSLFKRVYGEFKTTQPMEKLQTGDDHKSYIRLHMTDLPQPDLNPNTIFVKVDLRNQRQRNKKKKKKKTHVSERGTYFTSNLIFFLNLTCAVHYVILLPAQPPK